MKIEILEKPHRTVLFWTSKEEAANKAPMDSLKPQFAEWKRKKYLPVVMESGDGNLEETMYCLLKRNMERIAQSDKYLSL